MALILIIIASAVLRLVGLGWGDGIFFHPDENNMARAITGLCLPLLPKSDYAGCSMNPHFFAYGQLPLYIAYVLAFIPALVSAAVSFCSGSLSACAGKEFVRIPFGEAVASLRLSSSFLSISTIPLAYFTTTLLEKPKHIVWRLNAGHAAAILAAFTPGLIQSAHFGTTESMLTLLFLSIILLSLGVIANKRKIRKMGIVRYTFFSSLLLGLSLGTKLSGIFFLTPILATLIAVVKSAKSRKRLVLFILSLVFLVLTTATVYLLVSPFNTIALKEFIHSMNYESSVADGSVRVFYTRQFENTLPVIFQITNIFPFALGLPIFVLGSLGIVYSSIALLKAYVRKQKQAFHQEAFAILLIAFLGYFLPNAFLFAKWTRFMAPTFPLFAIFAAYALFKCKSKFQRTNFKILMSKGKQRFAGSLIIGVLIFVSIIPGLRFFLNVYAKPDSRIISSRWIYENIPENSYILSETANVVDIPVQVAGREQLNPESLPNKNYTVVSFDFYHLDQEKNKLYKKLLDHLEKSDYIFIPSRRIFPNTLREPEKYLLTASYYNALFNGKLGFELIYTKSSGQTACPAPPSLCGDEAAEETFTVFDHPTIRIYKKTTPKERQEYDKILNY